MRIVLVEFTSAMSGAERSLLELVQGLHADHDLTLACPPGPLADRAAELGVRVAPIPASQLTFRLHPRHTPRGVAAMARATRRLRSILRMMRPDMVHANSVRAGLLGIPAARGISPIVVHCRDALPQGLPGSLVRGAVLNGADHVVAISQHVATNVAGVGWRSRRVTVVENAVDLVRFDPAAVPRSVSRSALAVGDRLVLSVIAQITPWKGQDLAIRTLAELRRRGHSALLLIAGEAKFVGAATRHDNRAFEQELHSLARTLDLDDFVRFLGERPDPEHVLAATDVLLVPSTEEPFGRTIIEAMAMGVPVAATSVGGPAEILRDGIGGCVVAGRDPALWADAIEEMSARSPGQRAGARAKADARFSREQHVESMLSVYAGVLARGAQ